MIPASRPKRQSGFCIGQIFRGSAFERGKFGKQITQSVIHADAAQNDSQIADIKIAIKPQRHTGQKKAGQFIFPVSIEPIPPKQGNGQKNENKNIGVK